MVQVWFGDSNERELMPDDMYLAVYAAGGGKRNMANFVRGPVEDDDPQFRTSDVHVFLSTDCDEVLDSPSSKLFVCRFASSRGEWVPKPVGTYQPGTQSLKLIPEWFKARFWDNKQEKKHPWFMFGFLCQAADGSPRLFTSSAFPVHQYYPTGVKKTDPNDTACRMAFHRVLKQAPSTTLRPETLLRRASPSSFQPLRTQSPSDMGNFTSSEPSRSSSLSSSSSTELHRAQTRDWPEVQQHSDAMDMEVDDDDDSDYDAKPNFGQWHPQPQTRLGFYEKPVFGKSMSQRGLDAVEQHAVEALLALRSFPICPMR